MLGVKVVDANVSISGITSTMLPIKFRCSLSISSCNSDFSSEISCFVLKQITDNLPVFNFNISKWKIPPNVELADPEFNISSKIDLLIGADMFWTLLTNGRISLGKHMPILQNTVFGYIVSGCIPDCASDIKCYFVNNQVLHDSLERFWSSEETSSNAVLWSDEDKICEKHFTDNLSRCENGQFIVRLPIKMPITELGDSKTLALKRFLSLENRFEKNPDLKVKYVSFMNEYIMLNHMTLIDDFDETQLSYFLPHHGVIKEESLTTKLRTVFDGSAGTTSGKSLNDILFKGPAIQNDILHILLRFRIHTVVVTADIAKMYRCVLVNANDRNLQRILWRTSPDQPISVFELNTVTYGIVCAPFLAIRCLKQLALENNLKSPVASNIISQDFYVDDLITGFDNEKDAIEVCQDIFNILNSASFYLRKWNSNSNLVLERFDDSFDLDSFGTLKLGDNDQIKTLGVQWSSKTDVLSYQITTEPLINLKSTKRFILSQIAKVYDPLGLVSPCTILVKVLIQQLWLLKLDWDENVPFELEKKWLNIYNDLPFLNRIKIPRHSMIKNATQVELHGFCDASQHAYSAVIYVRSVNELNEIKVSLFCAKTKVAPLKAITIPRLELCGAVLLARLLKDVTDALPIHVEKYFWCDSQIVLHWLFKQPNTLQVFVGHRVSEIQSLTGIKGWSYVNTKQNPADVASRGVYPSDLRKSEIWWNGPEFLRGPSNWPILFEVTTSIMLPELKQVKIGNISTTSNDIFHKYSDVNKLIRVWAYCRRFISNCKGLREKRMIGLLSIKELNESLIHLAKIAQNETFYNEIHVLSSNKSLKAKHRLLSLAPFLDSEGVLRVGGRLKHSFVKFDIKHPILLDGRHKLSLLIFESEHLKLFHAGPQLLLAKVRRKFWITSGMHVAKSIVRKCVRCFSCKPQPTCSIMADLPKSRVNISSPFSISGVDYAGPFILKDRKGRGCKTYKAYLCLFICFTTKAVHLELVSDLTTESFISTLRRFCSRRGIPSHIYSDNGSNFVGAQRSLKSLYDFLSQSQNDIMQFCLNERITWHFIPPNSPNFGGLWESNIKGVKHHLYRVVGETILTYEEFNTFLVQIEATLNSRPLYPMSNDPNDYQPLTPSHFLIGKPLILPPEQDLTEEKSNRLTRFQLLQKMHQGFWKQWSQLYLTYLQQRNKWKTGSNHLKMGTLVIIRGENVPPAKWLLGRVIQLHPGADQIVRVVTVKTAHGLFKRAISKICILPLAEEEDVLNTTSVQGGEYGKEISDNATRQAGTTAGETSSGA